MGWALVFMLQASIHQISFNDYQSCVNAGNKININGQVAKFVCVEK